MIDIIMSTLADFSPDKFRYVAALGIMALLISEYVLLLFSKQSHSRHVVFSVGIVCSVVSMELLLNQGSLLS